MQVSLSNWESAGAYVLFLPQSDLLFGAVEASVAIVLEPSLCDTIAIALERKQPSPCDTIGIVLERKQPRLCDIVPVHRFTRIDYLQDAAETWPSPQIKPAGNTSLLDTRRSVSRRIFQAIYPSDYRTLPMEVKNKR
jgi:hypothetical protein